MKRYSFKKILLSLAMFTAGSSMAFGIDWDGGAGDWDWYSSTNWSTDTVPSTGSEVNLVNVGGTVDLAGVLYLYGSSDVTVSGSTTTLNITGNTSNAYCVYSAYSTTSTTSLSILNYATVNAAKMVEFGISAGGVSNTVLDNHATFDIASTLYVGYGGTAYLDMDRYSDLDCSGNAAFGYYGGSIGSVALSGGSDMRVNACYSGYSGSSVLTMDDSNIYADSSFYAGYNTGSYSSIDLANGSYLNTDTDNDNYGNFYSGYYGQSYVNVSGGSDIVAVNAYLGYNTNSYSNMTISGYGSTFNASSYILCGNYGTSILTLTDKAHLTADYGLTIGEFGSLTMTDSTIDCDTFSGSGTFNFNSGTLNVGQNLAVGAGNLLGTYCNLNSGHELNVDGTLTNERGATLRLTGTSLTAGNLENYSDVYSSASDVSVLTTFTNAGTLTMDGGELDCGFTFVNNPGGYVSGEGTITSSAGFYNSGSVSASGNLLLDGSLNNYAYISSSGLYNSVNVSGSVINDGDINLTNSTFSCGHMYNQFSASISGYGTLSGTIENNGGLIYAHGGTLNAGSLLSSTQGGELRIADNATLRVSYNFENEGYINMLGENSFFASSYNMNNWGVISGAGRISAAINNSGSLMADGGKLILGRNLSNNPDGLIEVMSDSTLLITRGLSSNEGSINLYGGRFDNGRNTLINNGYIIGNGTLTASGVSNYNYLGVGDGDMSIIADDFYNDGIVNIADDCTLTFFGDVTGGGSFSGDGGTVVFLASYSPGSKSVIAGDAAIMGDLLISVASTESDQLVVGKELIAGGDLVVTLADDYVPVVGDSFDLFDADSVSGKFSDISLPELSISSMSWDTSSLYLDGVITVVPEPCTIMLVAAGAMVAIGRKGR